VQKQTGRELILWPGSCIVHEIFSEKLLVQLKVQHPDAEVVAHPECLERVLQHADYIGSTKGILEHVLKSPKREFIVVTEAGILHQMRTRARTRHSSRSPRQWVQLQRVPLHEDEHDGEAVAVHGRALPELVMPESLRLAAYRP
jgi:quinolinate synthase